MAFLAFWLVEPGVLLLLYCKGYFMLSIEFPGVGKSWLLPGLKIAQFKLWLGSGPAVPQPLHSSHQYSVSLKVQVKAQFFLGTLAHRAQARQPLFWFGHSENIRKRKRPGSTDKAWNWTSGEEPCACHWVIRRLDKLLCESECFPERNMAVTQWYVRKIFAFLEKIFHMCFSPIPDTQRFLREGYHSLEYSSLLLFQQSNWPEAQQAGLALWKGWAGRYARVCVFHLPAIAAGCLYHGCECGILNLQAQFPCGQHDLIKSVKDPQDSRIRFLHWVL